MYYNPYIYIYIYIYINNAYVTSPHRHRMGPPRAATWPCVPRRIHVGPARKIPPFLDFFNKFFILKKLKIIQKKSGKIPKN